MYTIDNIIQKTLSYLPGADTDLIRRCYLYAHEAHKDAKRKSGIDYIQHPLAVADLVTTLKLDVPSICAAILHDVREDAPDRTLDLEVKFGKEIARIVEGVTKLKKYTFTSKQAQQAENFKRMIIAMSEDIRVILVKLCDRLNNMRELQFLRPEKQVEIASETLHIYAPLSDRLGISWIRTELQDLSFKYMMPEDYENLKKQADARMKERVKYIRNVIDVITSSLEKANLKGIEVTGRPKNLYGIYRKMKSQRIDLDQVYDFVAFRVIVQSEPECWNALGIIHGVWTPIMGRFKDWISVPKSNGYQSLHTSVIGPEHEPMEIQIRTWDMHKVAESGIAAHWRYKEGNIVDIKDEQKFNWLKQLVDWVRELQNPSDFLDTLKSDLFTDEIYLFTPIGDLRILQKGSTPVDFAYDIHTEIGNHCCGAKVNSHIASLNQPLKSGDIVEILTSKNQRPNRDWLAFVRTSKARN
ncbi:MAG: bifunctional (p)ppGpp synthetase/guanosine-3',5'-bis(diphosphate) 3'-pyrophosphohydrolase, partial [Deltaproteobacteria bacterium]|nr:bifunctional (p)ppGpp synthetase/guanosine-3',5'-bis(diphosphate) 3'-pyrophosphohydrolase [Deltaproteobacteria bacterium]